MQLGAGTLLFCMSQCTIPFCTLSPVWGLGFGEQQAGVEYGDGAGLHSYVQRYEEQGGDSCHGCMVVL